MKIAKANVSIDHRDPAEAVIQMHSSLISTEIDSFAAHLQATTQHSTEYILAR